MSKIITEYAKQKGKNALGMMSSVSKIKLSDGQRKTLKHRKLACLSFALGQNFGNHDTVGSVPRLSTQKKLAWLEESTFRL